MFTIEKIEEAHGRVRSGADFPKYIQDIKQLGVHRFETWVKDSHTEYFGNDNYKIASKSMYDNLEIQELSDPSKFKHYLSIHQQGKTDYLTFCKDCADTGIERWVVSLNKMTCIYYDRAGNEILVETIPQI